MLKEKIKFIKKNLVRVLVIVTILGLIFPLNTLVVLADPVPVEEVGANLEENTITAEMRIPQNNSSVVSNTSSLVQMLGEIVGPVYQLSTPGSYLTKNIYRYLMKHTEDELGIDKDFFRRMQKKQSAPTVDIVFAPTNPKAGEKVTAFAMPRNFRTSKEKLYFTWYIVHDIKTGNEKPDVEAGKKEAMRMVAAGNYDKDLFGEPKSDDENRDAYDASYGGDDGVGKKSGSAANTECEGCQCIKGMTMFGGKVNFGCFDDRGELLYHDAEEFFMAKHDRDVESAKRARGAVNSNFISRCYRHNFGSGGDANSNDETSSEFSGRDLIIKCQHAFGDGIGDRNFSKGEEESWGTNSEDADTDGDGTVDEADLAGLGQDEFTWIYQKGDKITVAVEGTSNIPINEGATNRLRYKNKYWDGDELYLDQSPPASPEQWYKDHRDECEDKKDDCLAATGNSLLYVPVGDRLPADDECIETYSDCMKDLWENKKWPENDEDAFGQMTGYYKIMWAAPGICSVNRMDEAKNDWCDANDDIGFQYLKLYDPVEREKKLFEVSVNVSPKNPQFSEPDSGDTNEYSDSTDMILASADVVSDDNVNPDYLYYKWSVWKCQAEDINECEDVTKQVKFKSHQEGLGIRDIGFYPTDKMKFDNDRALLKIGVVVKRHQNSVMSSPGINGDYEKQFFSKIKKDNFKTSDQFPNKYAQVASKLLEVTKHNVKIKLYEARPDGDGGWKEDKEICQEGLYNKVCPVFPYQVLEARVDGAGGAVSWKVNGKTVQPSLNETVNTEINSSTVFFPVLGTEGQLGRVTVTMEKKAEDGQWEDNNIVEERVFSIHSPMAKVTNLSGALRSGRMQLTKNSDGVVTQLGGQPLWWILSSWQGTPFVLPPKGSTLVEDIPVTIVPEYLQDELAPTNSVNQSNLEILTMFLYLNGDFKGGIQNLGGERSWGFKNVVFNDSLDKVNSLKIETLKVFGDDYKNSLKQAFGVIPVNEVVDTQKAKVKVIDIQTYQRITGQQAQAHNQSVKEKTRLFFASTIQNAPEYLIFVIRLAISVVLVMMVSFGLVFYSEKRA